MLWGPSGVFPRGSRSGTLISRGQGAREVQGVAMSGSVPCPSCGQPVPRGRLACPACGTLVAAVRSTAAPVEEAGLEAEPRAGIEPDTPADLEPDPGATPRPAGEAGVDAKAPPDARAAAASPGGAWAAERDDAVAMDAADGTASGGIVPGSYLPPSSIHRPAAARAAGSAAASWTAQGPSSGPGAAPPWAPPAAGVVPPGSPTPAVTGTADASTPGPSRPLTPGRASILADLPFDAPAELEGWLVTLGGGMGILGFFLPWRSAFRSGPEGYLDSWGLGIGANLPVLVLLLVVAALAIVPNRVAPWVRTGVCGMVTGGILFGLVWLYLEGGATQLGALLAAVGALLLIVGGVIAVAPGRTSQPGRDA